MTQANYITDSMESLFTSLGNKNDSVRYSNKKISDRQLLNMYSSSWLTGKYIDKTAEDMLKLPRVFSGDYDENLLKLVIEKENRLKLNETKEKFLAFSSLLGDALIVAITDADDLSQPLSDVEDIQRFIVLTKNEFNPDSNIDDDLKSANFGKPIYYTIGKNDKVHHSRCHRLKLGKSKLTDRNQFGTSDLQNKYNAIRLFDTTITCIGDIIQDSNVDVLFIPDLIAKVAQGKEDDIRKFINLINHTKSSMNAIALDAGNSEAQGRWEQKTATYGGLSEVLTKLITVTAGALDRPITVLFGLSASGFSTGEEDLESYHGTINALQESRLRPAQEFIDKFILDKMMPNHGLTFEYPSIKVVNEDKEAARFSQFASAFSALVTANIISDKVAQTELIARKLLINTTEEDLKDGDLFPTTEFPTGA
ncbi:MULTISPECIES: DUF1073 domain-containing protein [unclassified Gilliamella]|uniref:phage portal protein n=1 Tax=unclassified Gilliamella TaxID=2685620 RepID=UPI0018DB9817|nr:MULTISPECIES: DUF1073 domain-containing protein [unclassified Gilliamella]MBI0114472.1 DUF1073 domain-containing protein [Gilliamella sp. W8123]MBI0118159.1 DUF1073 domain-containing protein [Gilliamella sp. W8129]